MKTKKEFTKLVVQELKRCGISSPQRSFVGLQFENILAFATIIYLNGAIDALQDEQKGAR